MAFLGAAAAQGDEFGQIAIAVLVLGQQDEFDRRMRAVVQRQAAADDELQVPVLGGLDMGAHHPGQRAFIGDGQRRIAEFHGAFDQFFGMRGAREKAEIGLAVQFGVGGQQGGGQIGGHGAI